MRAHSLYLVMQLAAVTADEAVPPGCEGTSCRRDNCGDIWCGISLGFAHTRSADFRCSFARAHVLLIFLKENSSVAHQAQLVSSTLKLTNGSFCGSTEIDCSHFGNVCAGGAQAPVGVGWKYESTFAAPPLPPDFTSENATIFYYFNLLAQGQFVPQLVSNSIAFKSSQLCRDKIFLQM